MTEGAFLDWRRSNRFKNRTWRFAATVHTPLEKLGWYVDTLLEPVESVREAVVRVTEVVFEPRSLITYRKGRGIDEELWKTPAHLVSDVQDLRGLLIATFSDWVDFGVYMIPARFALAADHDELTRIFASKKSDLGGTVAQLREGGVEVIEPVHRLSGMPRTGPWV